MTSLQQDRPATNGAAPPDLKTPIFCAKENVNVIAHTAEAGSDPHAPFRSYVVSQSGFAVDLHVGPGLTLDGVLARCDSDMGHSDGSHLTRDEAFFEGGRLLAVLHIEAGLCKVARVTEFDSRGWPCSPPETGSRFKGKAVRGVEHWALRAAVDAYSEAHSLFLEACEVHNGGDEEDEERNAASGYVGVAWQMKGCACANLVALMLIADGQVGEYEDARAPGFRWRPVAFVVGDWLAAAAPWSGDDGEVDYSLSLASVVLVDNPPTELVRPR